jgi:putative resolvase
MEHISRPHEFATLIGKTVNTLQGWDREGILVAHRSPTNRRNYTHDQYLEYRGLKATGARTTIAYARVSMQAQKPDLHHQVEGLRTYCQAQGIQVDEWVEEMGSGLNFQCKHFTPSCRRSNWGGCSG